MVNLITGSGLTTANVANSTVFMAFHFDESKYSKVEYSRFVDGKVVTDPAASAAQEKKDGTFGENTVYYMFTVQRGIDTSANADCIVDDWSAEKTYTLTVKLTGPNGTSKTISADVKGETITLYQDVDAKVAGPFVAKNGNDVVIDLNDHKLEINNTATDKNRTFTAAQNSSLTIVGNDKTKSILNIAGSVSKDCGTSSVIAAETGASVMIKNVTYNTNGAALLPKEQASKVTIENSVIIAPTYVVATNNSYLEGTGTGVQIKVIGSTLKSDETPVCINANGVTLTIQGSTIEGKRHAVMVRSGAADIIGSTLISDNESCSEATWSSGTDVTPATLFVGNKASGDSYKGAAKVTMTGGFITAISGNAIATTNYDAIGKTAVDVSISSEITCGKESAAASITVSNLKYTATSTDNPGEALLVKTGSVEISGTIDSLTVVDGEVTVPEGKTLTVGNGGKLVFQKGASFNVLGEVIVDDVNDIAFESGSYVTGQNNIKSHDGNLVTVIPDYEDGAVVYKDGIPYTIYHAKTTAGTVQFGVAVGDLLYDGNDKSKDPFKNIAIASFDKLYTTVSAIADGKITNPNGGECVNVDTYDLAVSFTMSNTYGSVKVDAVGLTVDIQQAEVTPVVKIEGWSYGAWDEAKNMPQITYKGVVKGEDPGYAAIEYFQNDKKVADQKTIADYLENLKNGGYTFEVKFTGSKNYKDATAFVEFAVGKAAMNIDVTAPAAGDDFFGKFAKDFVKMDGYEVAFDGKEIKITGTIYYITDVNAFVGQIIFPDNEKTGYYAVFKVVNNNDFDITVTYGNSNSAVIKAGESETWMIYLGNKLSVDNTIYVTPSNPEFAGMEILISYSFGRLTEAGYGATKAEADAQITGATGVVLPDVIDRTMWILWTQSAQDGEVYGILTLANGEEVIYKEPQDAAAGTFIWYFSFNDQIKIDNPAGVYKLQIVNEKDGKTTVITEAKVVVPGTVDTGFEMNSEDAFDGIKKDFNNAGGDFTNRDDVAPKTLWMVYSQYGMEGKTLKANLIYNDKVVYSEPTKDADGLRCFYVSFDDQLKAAGVGLNAGTYTIQIVMVEKTTVGETTTTTEKVIYSGDVQIDSVDSKVKFDAATDDELVFAGVEAIDIQIDIKIDTSNNNTAAVTGQLFKLDGFKNFFGEGKDGNAGYYLAFTMKADGFDLNDAVITDTFENCKRNGQTYIVYLGNDAPKYDEDKMNFGSISVDFDGTGTFYNAKTYVFTYTYDAKYYGIILMDEGYYGKDGYLMMQEAAIDGPVLLPNGPDATKIFVGWQDINGVMYSAASVAVITKDMIGTDGIIRFTAIYEEEPVEPEYTNVFFVYGGLYDVAEMEIGTELFVPELVGYHAQKDGYTLIWTYNGEEITADTQVADGMVVIAQYTEVPATTATVTFVYGTQIDESVVDLDSKIAFPTDAAKDGYTIAWYVDGKQIDENYTIAGDVTVVAVYTAIPVVPTTGDVTFVYGGLYTVENMGLGAALVVPENIAKAAQKDGYTLVWTYNGAAITSETVVADGMVVIAQYTEVPATTATVTFVYGTQIDESVVDLDSKIAFPTDAAKDGYTIAWYVDGKQIDENYTIAGDVTVVAVYTEIETPVVYSTNMSVSLKSVDGTIYYSISALDGNVIPAGQLVVRYNYTVVDGDRTFTRTGSVTVDIVDSGSSYVFGTVALPSDVNAKSIFGIFQYTVSGQAMSERSATIYL